MQKIQILTALVSSGVEHHIWQSEKSQLSFDDWLCIQSTRNMASRFSILTASAFLIIFVFIKGSYLFEDLFSLRISEKEVFKISTGDPAYKIIHNLYERDLIRSEFLPKIIVSNPSISKNLKTGRYQFNPSDNLISMFFKLYKGIHISYQFNIIPGTNINDLRTDINNNNLKIHDNDNFELKERYIFPFNLLL